MGSNATAAQYFPYGQMQSGSTPTESQAFGSYVADESGLLYADQRYYYQNWGKFLTADASDRNVDYTNTVSFNRYGYVNGDPANQSDPTGLESTVCVANTGDSAGQCYSIPDGASIEIPDDQAVTSVTNSESITVDGSANDPLDQYAASNSGNSSVNDGSDGEVSGSIGSGSQTTQDGIKPTTDCSIYLQTGRPDLYAICRAFPTDKYSYYRRGCLQSHYSTRVYMEPWYSTIVIMPFSGPIASIIIPLYGPISHVSCAVQTGHRYFGAP